jgi:hypothetical protein
MLKENPNKIIQLASKDASDNRLKDKRMSRLKVFSGEVHPYADKFGSDLPSVKVEVCKKVKII